MLIIIIIIIIIIHSNSNINNDENKNNNNNNNENNNNNDNNSNDKLRHQIQRTEHTSGTTFIRYAESRIIKHLGARKPTSLNRIAKQ